MEKSNKPDIQKVKKFFDEMKPFKTVDDIPLVPSFYDKFLYESIVVKNLIRCGAIPKDRLIDGRVYEGTCRNSSMAYWSREDNQFTYLRTKWGQTYPEKINHFEDDNGYDLFVPFRLKTEEKENLVEK